MPRFLISRLSALGDVACTLPAAVALKRSFPGCEVVWAVDPRFSGVVECCRSVDHVVRLKPGWDLASRRVEGDFDAAFDLQGLLKSALVVGSARARVKLGYHWQREGARFFSSPVRPDPTSWHVTDQYVDVVRAYGATMERAEFDLAPHVEDLDTVRSRLAERKVGGRFVALNAGAGWASKRWPPAHFAVVAKGLADRGISPVFLGAGEADEAVFAEIGFDGAVSMIGMTNVRELVALVSLAAAHLGGDTGSTHLAAALSVPAIGLYSLTRPERCCPYGQYGRCFFNPAGLAEIGPLQVLKAVLEAVEGVQPASPSVATLNLGGELRG
jgi:ADP-heptose:LPS heptosyltransferase